MTDVNADPSDFVFFRSDARRPCSTCVRSHAYALSHAAPAQRAGMPQRPDCTYDEGNSNAALKVEHSLIASFIVAATLPAEQAPPAPKTRYEKLECRISKQSPPYHRTHRWVLTTPQTNSRLFYARSRFLRLDRRHPPPIPSPQFHLATPTLPRSTQTMMTLVSSLHMRLHHPRRP